MALDKPDLTKYPPRSPRVRLGGFVILPRILDKGRATLNGTNGEYHFDCPMDQRFLEFVGIEAEALKAVLAEGKGDQEVLDWVLSQSTTRPKVTDVLAWTAFQEQRVPGDLESREFFNSLQKTAGPLREDIGSWFDLLDLDDFVSFGGKA